MIHTDKAILTDYLNTLSGAIRVERVARKRSTSSNNLYWVWLCIIGDHLGYFKDEVHEICLDMFAPRKSIMERFVIIRTSEMDQAHMAKYMDRVKMWAVHELNITLPEPDQAEEIYRYYQLKGML